MPFEDEQTIKIGHPTLKRIQFFGIDMEALFRALRICEIQQHVGSQV